MRDEAMQPVLLSETSEVLDRMLREERLREQARILCRIEALPNPMASPRDREIVEGFRLSLIATVQEANDA